MKKIIFLQSGSTDPVMNLAIEQQLFDTYSAGTPIVYIWQNDKCAVLGRYQNVYEELDLEYAQQNDISVVRRNTGGGAVYHDLGNLNYSFIAMDKPGEIDACEAVLKAVLDGTHTDYCFCGRNDIFIGASKISGRAGHTRDGKILTHGTLLVNSNLEALRQVLTRRNKVLDSKSIKSKPRTVGNISEFSDNIRAVCDLEALFEEILGKPTRIHNYFTVEEYRGIEALARSRYGNKDWTYGFCPEFDYRSSFHNEAGTVTVHASIDSNVIRRVSIRGDFFALKSIEEFERRLIGIRPDDIELCELQQDTDYINGISNNEILKMLRFMK